MIRSINRKLADIAEAGWNHGDAASREDDDYGQYGRIAERRVERLTKQVEVLALIAIQSRGNLSDARMVEIACHPSRDQILAEALVGAWDKVAQLCGVVFRDALAASRTAYAAALPPPAPSVTLEPRDRNNPNNYPCCGGLRISRSHSSNCREA